MADLLKRQMPFAVAKIAMRSQAAAMRPTQTHPNQRI